MFWGYFKSKVYAIRPWTLQQQNFGRLKSLLENFMQGDYNSAKNETEGHRSVAVARIT